jgi:O-antigen ligase
MGINLLNLIFIVVFLLFSLKHPKTGVLATFVVLLFLPISFSMFGFSFGEGDKYLPNLFLIASFYALYYFAQAQNKRSVKLLDIAIVLYMVFEVVISLIVSNFTANPGVWFKGFLILPLFYFMGKVFLAENDQPEKGCILIRNLLLAIGPYIIFFSLLEYFSGINIHVTLLYIFKNLVGSQVNIDPTQILEIHLQGGFREGFYRLLGPQVESTETALVACISFVAYLSWAGATSVLAKFVRTVILILLLGVIVLNGTRTIIVIVPLVFAAREVFKRMGRKRLVFVFAVAALSIFSLFVVSIAWEDLRSAVLQDVSTTPYYSTRLMDISTYLTRISAWKDTLVLIKDNPFFGVGIGTPVYLLGPTSSIYTSHNLYLDILLFQGALGMAMLTTLVTILSRQSLLVMKYMSEAVLGKMALTHILILTVFLTFGLASPEKIQISSLFWFYAGMVSNMSMRQFIASL